MTMLPFRQIHLDFHTSELIAPVGEGFDAARFADTLVRAHVNSVTCFSRCHHGMIYHDTKFAELRHPGLTNNLLGEQIAACHARGIRVPIYITVGWDEYHARTHPEWLEVRPDGGRYGAAPFQPGWKKLCFNTPYVDFVIDQTREVLDRFPCDGFFFDIVFQNPCACQRCIADMLAENLDPALDAHRANFAAMVLERFKRRMTAAVRERNLDAAIFFNAGHVAPGVRGSLDTYSHLELESLPSGGWGYDHFPFTVRYARNLGLETLGMTGKFHASWGDFGGFKNLPALEYECFTALAEGSKCSIGDQLHPRGALDPASYDLIGKVYAQVEIKEPWCEGAAPVTEIAIFHPDAIGVGEGQVDESACGAFRMLIESHHQFDLVDLESDWTRYRVLILPDKIVLDEALCARISAYLDKGGAVIASHASLLNRAKSAFALENMPARFAGESSFQQVYVQPLEPLADDIPMSPQILYESGFDIEPGDEAEILAETYTPYFNRAWNHFCSHSQTPPEKKGDSPAAIRAGNVVYFTHPLFRMFMRRGVRTYKQLVLNALNLLLPEPLVKTNAPTTAHITLLFQPIEQRHVLHVLHYIPERRYRDLATIEDVIPLRDVEVGLRLPAPQAAYLAPSGEALTFTERGGRVWLTIPEVHGHAMVVLEGHGGAE